MSEEIPPKNTAAIVVGIEKYAYSKDWDLHGPADDAVSFVEWLRGRDVHPNKIRLFLSPLTTDPERKRTLETRCRRAEVTEWQDATSDNIRKAILSLDGDAAQENDLLYLFWSGHGTMDYHDNRYLFCADAISNYKACFEIGNIWRWLRHERKRQIKRQIGIVDSCADYFGEKRLKRDESSGPAVVSLPVDSQDPKVRQSVLYSAARGERAFSHNNSLHKTADFSKVILERLNHDKSGKWPPDFDKLAENTQSHFEDLRRNGLSQQTPVYYIIESEKGRKTLLGNLIDPIDQSRRISEVRERVLEIETSPDERYKCYLDTLRHRGRHINNPENPDQRNLDKILGNLAEMEISAYALSPLMEFTWRMAHSRHTDLANWVEEQVQDKAQLVALRRRINQEKQEAAGLAALRKIMYLMIDIDEPVSIKRTFPNNLRCWLHDGERATPLDEIPCSNSANGLRESVIKRVNELESGQYTEYNQGDLFIEFFVSIERVFHDMDQWEYAVNTKLGVMFPVVVRWRERTFIGAGIIPWRNVADRIKNSLGLSTVFWLTGHNLPQEQIIAHLRKGSYGVCVGLTIALADGNEATRNLLRFLFHGGVPFAFWPRQHHADSQSFTQTLQSKLDNTPIDEIPRALMELRYEAAGNGGHAGEALTVLWDDPRRNPLVEKLQKP